MMDLQSQRSKKWRQLSGELVSQDPRNAKVVVASCFLQREGQITKFQCRNWGTLLVTAIKGCDWCVVWPGKLSAGGWCCPPPCTMPWSQVECELECGTGDWNSCGLGSMNYTNFIQSPPYQKGWEQQGAECDDPVSQNSWVSIHPFYVFR